MKNEDKIIAYFLGELNPKDREELQQALEVDPQLKDEFEAYQIMFGDMEAFEYTEPSPELKAAFQATMDQAVVNKKSRPKSKLAFLKNSFMRRAAIAASILIAGILIGYSLQKSGGHSGSAKTVKKEFVRMVNADRTSQRLQGISMLEASRVMDEEVLKVLKEVLYNDPSTNVRLAVIESLSDRIDQEPVKLLLLGALKDIDVPVIRINLIYLFTGAKEPIVKTIFEEMLQDEDLDKTVRDELHTGLMKISRTI